MSVACGITAGILALIMRGMGPNIQDLQLTGVHSRFGTFIQSTEFVTTRDPKNSSKHGD